MHKTTPPPNPSSCYVLLSTTNILLATCYQFDTHLELAQLHGECVQVLLLGDGVPVGGCNARPPVQLELGLVGRLDVCRGLGGEASAGRRVAGRQRGRKGQGRAVLQGAWMTGCLGEG